MYYFLRVNGDTGHNNRNDTACFVPGEPPAFPNTYFNYLDFCLKKDIVRIGWPDSGDLTASVSKTGALATCYDLDTVPSHVRAYLLSFRVIALRSIILVPDKDHPGDIYICAVTGGYHYFHNVPTAPYECAHRLKVVWDKDISGHPTRYSASQLGIGIQGGFWRKAFHEFPPGDPIINNIDVVRAAARMNT
jgi:hypothetical protein